MAYSDLQSRAFTQIAYMDLDVNRCISNLDGRMDSLYWRVGLLDLWNLMQADILTGYSWRLSRCASYLSDTATDFVNAENDLVGKLQ